MPKLITNELLFSHLARDEKSVFDVTINGAVALDDFYLDRYEPFRAVEKKIVIQNKEDPLTITFKPVRGETVVNGIGIRKID